MAFLQDLRVRERRQWKCEKWAEPGTAVLRSLRGDDDHLGQKVAANAFLGRVVLREKGSKETRLPAPGLKPILKNNVFRETEWSSDVSQCLSCNNN